MAKHISLRVAWHDSGWNGHICKNPKENTYCSGNYSYPGDLIKGAKKLEWESDPKVAGCHCSKVEEYPPCATSINAFGKEEIKALSEPPDWFNDDSNGVLLNLPPATACTWFYEGMYTKDVLNKSGYQTYDYDKRLKKAEEYFTQLEKKRSLIFYYANYSNPFSEEDEKKYVVVGISRFLKKGNVSFYENVSDENKRKYAGGFVWQMPITSNYPEEGFSIPYHLYMDNPEILRDLTFIPENQRNFKYATRTISDDDALSYVERFLEIVKKLIEIKDETQDWEIRKKWLIRLLDELWKNRGAYPGIMSVLNFIDFTEAKEYYKICAEKGNDKNAFVNIFELLEGKRKNVDGLEISGTRLKEVARNWKLRDDNEQKILKDVLPRLDISFEQVKNILSPKREVNNLYCDLEVIAENPYLLSEQYIGDDIDDIISFNKIDHGVLPSPDLGIEKIFAKNSSERFRALCVEQLKYHSVHTFISALEIINQVNNKLSYLPDWKKELFTIKYLEVDETIIEEAIKIKNHNGEKYLYLLKVFEDERNIQKTLESFAQRNEIEIKRPFTIKDFVNSLKDSDSDLLTKAENEYIEAINSQAEICQKVFNKCLTVISGAAGTGKTTIIKTIIYAIEKVHGSGSSIFLLAPTGKASERLKEKTDKKASTIHSFLASNSWLNDNFTFKRLGGKVDETIGTLIIDECSMIDLELFAVLFRAINWNSIQRLILVGDPNQLPPIGRGKVFYEIIEWLKENYPENIGVLEINVRQLENRVLKNGNGILDLAEIYIQEKQSEEKYNSIYVERIMKKLQEGGDVDSDLNIQYWENSEVLKEMIKNKIVLDMENDSGLKIEDGNRFYQLLDEIVNRNNYSKATYQQVISPFRGESFGVDNMNIEFQKLFNSYFANKSAINGIALFDKVIQIRNRPKSNKICAYNLDIQKPEYIEIYNGEIGFVKPHAFDNNKFKCHGFRLEKFQVVFNRRENYWVGFGKNLGKDDKGKWIKEESPEDNLELGYVLSVHKAQGSEFERVYLILPNTNSRIQSMELLYTAITRAKSHLTIFVENDVSTFLSFARKESSCLRKINSSLFNFNPLPNDILKLTAWYPEGKIYSTLSEFLVRSKSEVIIANLLSSSNIPFSYETPLFAKDGTMFLPDFTVIFNGETYYWEHLGRLDLPEYKNHWETKKKWYEDNFPNRLIMTYETQTLTKDIEKIIIDKLGHNYYHEENPYKTGGTK
jgi:ATP-dependent exoDNAse (exonuclease V) alpha subunit